jgi:hypothetical protein
VASASRTKWLIIAGAVFVAVSLPAALFMANERELRTRNAIRTHGAAIMFELTGEMDAAAAAMHAFNTDGGLDLTGLADEAALRRRIDLAAKAQTAAQRVLDRGNSAADRLAAALKDLPPDRIAAAKAELPQKMNWPHGRQIFDTHARAYAAAKAHLQFLEARHGHWRIDPVGLRVNWDSESLQAEAEKLQAQVTAAAHQQGSLSATTTALSPARD